MVQPLEKLSPREESLVKAAHDFWVRSRDISTNSKWLARFALFLCRVVGGHEAAYEGEAARAGEPAPSRLTGAELGNSSSESSSANNSSNLTSFFTSSAWPAGGASVCGSSFISISSSVDVFAGAASLGIPASASIGSSLTGLGEIECGIV